MRKLFLLPLILILILPSMGKALAQENWGVASDIIAPVQESRVALPPATSSSNFFGQNHRYSVIFRGNGEAVVTTSIAFYNNADYPLSELELRVPKVIPTDIIAFQVIKEKSCIRYGAAETEPNYYPNDIYSPTPTPYTYRYKPYQQTCLEYQQPDYYYWNPYSGNQKYQKAKSIILADTIKVILPQPILPGFSGNFVLYYRALGYASKNAFGAFDFNFETLKVEDKIHELVIGINTDSDLYIKGAKSSVNYRFDYSVSKELNASQYSIGAAPNTRIDSLYQNIGQGTINKVANELQPLDSYTVKGKYADSWTKLYGKEILITAIFFIIFLVLAYLIVRKILRKRGLSLSTGVESYGKQSRELNIDVGRLIKTGSIAFISSFISLLYTLSLIFILDRFFNYVSYQIQPILGVLIVLISACFYIIVILGPAIYVGIKKGIWWGISLFIMTMLWLIVYLLIIVVLFLGFSNNSRPYPIMY